MKTHPGQAAQGRSRDGELPGEAAAMDLPRLAKRAGQIDTAGGKGLTLAPIGDGRAAFAASPAIEMAMECSSAGDPGLKDAGPNDSGGAAFAALPAHLVSVALGSAGADAANVAEGPAAMRPLAGQRQPSWWQPC